MCQGLYRRLNLPNGVMNLTRMLHYALPRTANLHGYEDWFRTISTNTRKQAA